MKYLIDTSVLLRATYVLDGQHAICSEVIDPSRRPAVDTVICAQVLIEFWAVATRPASVNGLGLSPAEAMVSLEEIRSVIPMLPESPDVYDYWFRLVRRFGVRGRPTHDARLVGLMDAYGVSGLITLNQRDFLRYPHAPHCKPA